jgi:hypothetical protein
MRQVRKHTTLHISEKRHLRARIKPFLAEKDIKSVVRICTDSVTLTREFPAFTTEDDTIKIT